MTMQVRASEYTHQPAPPQPQQQPPPPQPGHAPSFSYGLAPVQAGASAAVWPHGFQGGTIPQAPYPGSHVIAPSVQQHTAIMPDPSGQPQPGSTGWDTPYY